MKAELDREARSLGLRFESVGEAREFAAGVGRESGFVVQLARSLALHHEIRVELILAHGPEGESAEAAGAQSGRLPTGELVARVAQVFDKGYGRHGTALIVEDAGAPERWLDELTGETEAPQPVDAALAGEMRGTSPIHRIRQMNPRQRAILALKAGRTERRILLRDKSPQVLQNLLANPRVDAEEVLQIARSSHVVAPLLQRIAGDSRWNGNREILAIIARHPKTPSLLAARLMPSLRTADLRTMARMSSGLREMVRKAALREYMRRTGQRM